MPRQFNTAHANRPEEHYTLPPLGRLPPDVRDLVDDGYYFVLHAPRQSGKTTSMLALAELLRQDGRYAVVFASVESGRVQTTEAGIVNAVVRSLVLGARDQVRPDEQPPAEDAGDVADPGGRLYTFLKAWAKQCPRPLVLILDEIDCLHNEGLVSVLSQFRMGYAERPKAFPHSIAFVGRRDVSRHSPSEGEPAPVQSFMPFNIIRDSISLRPFDRTDIVALVNQHTAAAGHVFAPVAIDLMLTLTAGQPSLVNCLAAMATQAEPAGNLIDVQQITAAKDSFVRAPLGHIDVIQAVRQDDRVRRFLTLLTASKLLLHAKPGDEERCRELGIVSGRYAEIANPIYQELVPLWLAGPR